MWQRQNTIITQDYEMTCDAIKFNQRSLRASLHSRFIVFPDLSTIVQNEIIVRFLVDHNVLSSS